MGRHVFIRQIDRTRSDRKAGKLRRHIQHLADAVKQHFSRQSPRVKPGERL